MGDMLEDLTQLDFLVANTMAEWQIPGLAMAVMRKGKPTLQRCWGVRDIETGAPVTPDTVFPICSVTKSFTATGLALLVDQGQFDWDTPVRNILPSFRLSDPVATEQTTLRYLLTHRTGCHVTTGFAWAAISTTLGCSPHSVISNPANHSAAPISIRT
jgi:CubicO group peptidase (beta-lactamase class C family)